jgi:hypothetical protein
MKKIWNRSSALTPEELGIVNTATITAIEKAVQTFNATPEGKSLNEEQRKEAYRLITEKVADGINKFAETLK